ncbi:MAG: hypothetical protein JOZ75_13605 [Candidatus Dormibacteraeota bacterium]|nr:hypothetical protein [Candidatus Dormibacteraeota bacterium]
MTLSPQALVNIALPPSLTSLLAQLPCNVGTVAANALTNTTTVSLDASSNDGVLNSGATDFVSGEATSEALGVDLQGIDGLVTGVENVLNGDLSCLTGNSSTALPVNVQTLLTPLTSALQGVVTPLHSVLGQLSATVNINKSAHVTLDQNPLLMDLLDLSTPLGDLNLGPYDAVAVSQAGAQKYGITTGPQLEAHNSTTNIAIGASLPLGSVSSLGNLTDLFQNLTTTLQGDLSSITSQLGLLNPGGGALPTTSVVQTVCTTLGGLLGGATTTCSTLTPATGVSALTPQLTALQGSLTSLLNGLPALQNVLGALPKSIDLLGLITTGGETSSVLTQPQNGGVHSIASTVIPDLKVLEVMGTPLLELKGLSSSAEAFVNGVDTSAPKGTVSFLELDILGHAIVIPGLGTNQTITVPTPLGDVTVVIGVGTPQTINNTPTRKTEAADALHVAVINGDANGKSPIALLGGAGGTVVDVLVAGSQVDDAMTAVAAVPQTSVQATSTNLPSTGMVGPLGFAVVVVLGLAAAGLRFAARRSGRAAGSASDLPID